MAQTVQRSEIGDQKVNEDRIAARIVDGGILLLLADGMGGHEAGDLAAQAVIDAADETLTRNPALMTRPDLLLARIFDSAHGVVSRLRPELPEMSRPRTTAVGCVIAGSTAHWAHVGDSRLYHFRDGTEIHRTIDHTAAYDLYKTGNMMREDLRGFIRRNQLERSLGGDSPEAEIEHSTAAEVRAGDIILLCSDGVWASTTGAEMAQVFAEQSPAKALDIIVDTALVREAPDSDNVTALAHLVS